MYIYIPTYIYIYIHIYIFIQIQIKIQIDADTDTDIGIAYCTIREPVPGGRFMRCAAITHLDEGHEVGVGLIGAIGVFCAVLHELPGELHVVHGCDVFRLPTHAVCAVCRACVLH